MGVECPQCHTHQPVTKVITADGEPPKKATDVMAKKLACGHTIGGAHYNEYVKRVTELDTEVRNKIASIQEEAHTKKSALWATISETRESD